MKPVEWEDEFCQPIATWDFGLGKTGKARLPYLEKSFFFEAFQELDFVLLLKKNFPPFLRFMLESQQKLD